ncbi:MAG: DUF3037 domain-containing protein [Candidatus Acidiferrales bacterium]
MNDERNGKENGERNDERNHRENNKGNDGSNGQRKMLTYRILRYVPNLMRDEWVNIGVLLEDGPGAQRAIKLIEEDSEFASVRRLNPAMDDSLLRGLAGTFDAELRKPNEAVAAYLEKLNQTLSNAVQFGPVKGVYAEDFEAELDRLYQDQVAPPARARGGIIESTRAWIKARLNDVFRRRRVPQLARAICVEEFTQPGDPLRLDYGYRNGVQGYIQAVALGRDTAQAKVLAYTAERIRARVPDAEFTAITEIEPGRDNSRHQFMVKLFDEQRIAVVPLNRVERFAEDLRARLQ